MFPFILRVKSFSLEHLKYYLLSRNPKISFRRKYEIIESENDWGGGIVGSKGSLKCISSSSCKMCILSVYGWPERTLQLTQFPWKFGLEWPNRNSSDLQNWPIFIDFQRADFSRVEVKCHREMNARSNKTIQMYRSIGKLKFRRSSYEACIVRDISCNRNCRCKLSVKFITTYNQTLRAINHEGLRTSCITSIERVFIKNNFRQFRQEYSKNRTLKSIN